MRLLPVDKYFEYGLGALKMCDVQVAPGRAASVRGDEMQWMIRTTLSDVPGQFVIKEILSEPPTVGSFYGVA